MRETIKNLINRFWPTGALIVFGFFLIIYAALGILYFQQGAKQRDLQEQIAKMSAILVKPLPSAQKLRAEYKEANEVLAPITVPAALDIIVNIAKESGIEVDPDSGEFSIPPVGSPGEEKVGEGTYRVLSIKNIKAQGDYENVMAFIAALDSGEKLKNLVLQSVDLKEVKFKPSEAERARREEFRQVSLAVMKMMADNGLSVIPNPIDYAGGVATNFMGDNPNTWEVVEGFPDNTTTAAAKGYTGTETPRDGYVLHEHDKITTDTDNFTTVSYIPLLETEYYYTCEADGTVRQFDGPDVATATEYPKNEREARRRELHLVSQAVIDMMIDNGLSVIPNPIDYAGGVATNFMGDNPNTGEIVEGFPDNTTPIDAKGYTGTDFPRVGYVLYQHDRISTDNTTLFDTVSYIPLLETEYYYTCEADGTVRQFDGPDVATATEYLNIDTIAILNVKIYTRPVESD